MISSKIENAKKHFKTVTAHRNLVMKYCFKCGLYKQGLLHDLSKYSPSEFIIGILYYQGTRSPNVAERVARGYSSAWLHHKGRNKHHYEYWFDNDDATLTLQPVEMPVEYVVEMFCDRVSASRIYKGDAYTDDVPLMYFEAHDYRVTLHPNTRELLGRLLKMLADEGEEKTFKYIRKLLKQNKKNKQ